MLEALRAAEEVELSGQALQEEYARLQAQHTALQSAHKALQAQHDEATQLAAVFETEATRMQQLVDDWQQRPGTGTCAACGGTVIAQRLPVEGAGVDAQTVQVVECMAYT